MIRSRVRRLVPARRSVAPGVAAFAAAFASAASAAPPPAGGLVQLAPPQACFASTAAGGCASLGDGGFISSAKSLTITPDGRSVYAVGDNGGGATFDRAGGLLTSRPLVPYGSILAAAPDNLAVVAGNRDGNGSLGSVRLFSRDPATGTLGVGGFIADSCGKSACATDNGLADVQGLAVSPDGTTFYATGQDGGGHSAQISGGAVTAFTRSPGTEAIKLIQCVPRLQTASGVCSTSPAAEGLKGAEGIVVSPDGAFVYVAGRYDGSVVGFNRVSAGPNKGKLGAVATCLTKGASTVECQHADGLTSAAGIAISPDGRDVYVAAFNDGVVALRRDTVSGVMSETECLDQAGSGGCSKDPALSFHPRTVTVSPDGRTVYVTGGDGVDGAVRAYARDGASGRLTPVNCLSTLGLGPCQTAAGLKNAVQSVVSPDGTNLYAVAGQGGDDKGAISGFRIEAAPSCTEAAASTASGAAVVLPLACTDSDGEPLTRSIVSGPAHGTLGAIDQVAGSVNYQPAPGFSGTDAIAFTASDGTNAAPARGIGVTVAPPPLPLPSPPGPTPPGPKPATPGPKVTAVSLRVTPLPRQHLRTVARIGLGVKLRCSRACTAKMTLTLSRAEARRLHLGSRGLTVAAARVRLKANRTRTVRLKLRSVPKAKTRRARKARFSLKTVASATGRPSRTRRIAIRVTR